MIKNLKNLAMNTESERLSAVPVGTQLNNSKASFLFMSEYSELLKRPEWKEKRLEIINRDHSTCQICKSTYDELNVHHKKYIYGKQPWDYPNEYLVTLCEICHFKLHANEFTKNEIFDLFREWYYDNHSGSSYDAVIELYRDCSENRSINEFLKEIKFLDNFEVLDYFVQVTNRYLQKTGLKYI